MAKSRVSTARPPERSFSMQFGKELSVRRRMKVCNRGKFLFHSHLQRMTASRPFFEKLVLGVLADGPFRAVR